MKFGAIIPELKAGQKIKMPHWQNAYWYLDKFHNIVNHDESGNERPVHEMLSISLVWMIDGDWEVVKEARKVVEPQPDTFGFEGALYHLKVGNRVTRQGWNGNGAFLVYCPGNTVPASHMKVKAVKDFYKKDGISSVVIAPHIDMKAADGTYVTGWQPSQADMLAEDWMIV